jgi:Gpi18-like mannosyltransferase
MSAPRRALPAAFGVGLLLALAVRLAALPFVSGDMRIFHVPWSEAIEREGAWRALAQDFSNYPPLYLYALTAATWLPLPRVWAIKLVHGVFDLVLAAYAAGIVAQLARGAPASGPAGASGRRGAAGTFGDEASPPRDGASSPRGAFLAVLLMPTVVMNAALWGQCDAMYAAGMVACVHYVIAGRPAAGMVALGLAFSLKPQAVFLGPWVVLLTLRGHVRWPHWYLVPATYFLCAVPALLAGRPFGEILLLYPNQPILPFPSLTLGATNLYQWLSDRWFSVLYPAGLALGALTAAAYVVVLHRRWPEGDRGSRPHPGPLPVGEGEGRPSGPQAGMADRLETGATGERGHLLATALLATLLMPYVLPAMHERYFFPADVLALVAAWTLPRFVPVAALVLTASTFTYLPYLFDWEPLPRPLLAALMTGAILLTIREALRGTDRR